MNHFSLAIDNGRSVESVIEELMGCYEFGGKLFVPPGHFYSPIVNTSEASEYLTSVKESKNPSHLPGIKLDAGKMIGLWKSFQTILNNQPFGSQERPGLAYQFENPAFSWADGLLLHSMLLTFKPKRIVEIGCGWSSACLLDTIALSSGWSPSVTFVDPYPGLLNGFLKKSDKLARSARVIGTSVQEVDLKLFDELCSGDVLFIDSTHVAKTGSDVLHEMFNVLPRLKAGVLVHFHDVFWPFEYPDFWVIDENRSWNELYFIRAYLEGRSDWEIVFFNDFMAKQYRDEISNDYPDFLRNTGGSIWIRKIAA